MTSFRRISVAVLLILLVWAVPKSYAQPIARVEVVEIPIAERGAPPAVRVSSPGWNVDAQYSRALFSVSLEECDVNLIAPSGGSRVQERDGWVFTTDPVRGGLWRLPLFGGAAEHVARLDPVDAENWDVTPEAVYLVDRRMGAPWMLRIDAQTGVDVRVMPLPATYAGGLDVKPTATHVLVGRFVMSEEILSAESQ